MISCIEPIQSLNKTDVKRGLGILILVLFFCPLCKGLNAYIRGCFALYWCRCPIGRVTAFICFSGRFYAFFSTDIGLYGVGGKIFDLWGMVYIFGVLIVLYSGQMYSVHTPRLILRTSN